MKLPTRRWPWLRLAGAFDARFDTHQQVERSAHLDWQDRTLQRPALSLREFNATITKGKLTAEFGKQFIRWGKADILNPTDRFAPKDFLTVTDPDFLAVLAARVIYDTGTDSFDLVWQPRFTPSRTPLLNERWTVLPQAVDGLPLVDLGSEFPGRSSFGARWNHIGSGYEFSASFYDGFNSLPVFQGISQHHRKPRSILCGLIRRFDCMAPMRPCRCRWFTVKTEAAYYTSPDHQQDEYVIYVIQFERQIKELSIVAGYAGDAITARTPTLQFSPELGFARAVLAHAQYTIDSNRSVSVDAAVRQNGQGSWLRAEYSQAFGAALARYRRLQLDSRRRWRFPGPVSSQFVRAAGAADIVSDRDHADAQRLIHFLGVPVRFHFVEDLLDLAVLADQERAALDTHVLASVHALLHPGPVGFGDLVIHVGEQREGQIELVLELGLRGRFVGRHADDHGVGLGELLRVIAKLAGFARAAGRVRLGIKIQHHVLAFETGEIERLSLVILYVNRGRRVAFLQSFGHRNILTGGRASRMTNPPRRL